MPTLKTVAAFQEKKIYKYESTKSKTLNCSANILFKQQCLKTDIIPIYVNMNIPSTLPAGRFTKKAKSTNDGLMMKSN